MNIFRLLGDLSHLLAIIILLLKIWKTRSCAGKLYRLWRDPITRHIMYVFSNQKFFDSVFIFRYIRKVSDTFLRGVHGALLGSVNQLHFCIQYVHEDGVHYGLIRHCLPDVCQVQSDLWPQSRHIQDRILVDTYTDYGFVDKPWIHSNGG